MGKPILHVKGLSLFIDGVYHYGVDCDIVANGQGSLNRVRQKHLANSLALRRNVYGQSTNESSRYRVLGQFLCEFFWQHRQINGKGTERVIAQHSCVVLATADNEYTADPAFYILVGLVLQVAIQGLNTTVESGPVVVSVQWLNDEFASGTH
jgi:hypothetical protein